MQEDNENDLQLKYEKILKAHIWVNAILDSTQVFLGTLTVIYLLLAYLRHGTK